MWGSAIGFRGTRTPGTSGIARKIWVGTLYTFGVPSPIMMTSCLAQKAQAWYEEGLGFSHAEYEEI